MPTTARILIRLWPVIKRPDRRQQLPNRLAKLIESPNLFTDIPLIDPMLSNQANASSYSGCGEFARGPSPQACFVDKTCYYKR
jgi:hypothetical protein